MKKFFKRISAIAVVMTIFMCSSSFSSAAVCDKASISGHTHNYIVRRQVSGEYLESWGPHTYLDGRDHFGNEIYKNDCILSYVYADFDYKCEHCDALNPNGPFKEMLRFHHSKEHGM